MIYNIIYSNPYLIFMFYCYDTTTTVMDFLNRVELKPIICLNKEFNTITKKNYYKFRIIQHHFKRWRRLKCHNNISYCYKISKKELIENKEKYIGKTIQFIIIPRPNCNVSSCGYRHYIMWQCKLRDIKCPNYKDLFGLLVSHVGYVDYNVYKKCGCNSGGIQFGSNIDSHTFLKFEKIFSFSLRII